MQLVRNLELERDVKFIQMVLYAMYELFSRREVKDVWILTKNRQPQKWSWLLTTGFRTMAGQVLICLGGRLLEVVWCNVGRTSRLDCKTIQLATVSKAL